eukprot:TRINITY_DN20281_c1_g1_i1.p3 TRINITY_DN20281_c1_g1~~TRINITY_DN20281_c1_g1_i1.p3  ORF type:complete len:182 (-),score=34.90 TRINITY_DN20281_c1_g1_i1:170-640(-)
MMFGLTNILCYFVALLYPTYASFKAIESTGGDDDKQWLTYWIVYSLMSVVEVLVEWILEWIPLYFEAKLLFIAWLIAPQTKGALLLYEKFIRPFLQEHASQIDPVFKQVGDIMEGEDMQKTIGALSEKAKDKDMEAIMKKAAEHAERLSKESAKTK